jgi:NADH-quinone oxidoreductase subunit L
LNPLSVPQTLLLSTVLIPALIFLGLALAWLAGWNPKERTISSVTMWGYGFAGLTLTALVFSMVASGVNSVSVEFGNWYAVHNFQIPLVLFVDRLSIPLLALTMLLAGLVAGFSRRYVHRDRGFQRFFLPGLGRCSKLR